jgi:hypothetical protein
LCLKNKMNEKCEIHPRTLIFFEGILLTNVFFMTIISMCRLIL